MKLFKIFKVKTRKAGKDQTIKPIPPKNEPLKRDVSVHNFEVGHLIKERTEQSVSALRCARLTPNWVKPQRHLNISRLLVRQERVHKL